MLFDITAEGNEILYNSSFIQIFHPVSDAEVCQDRGLQKSD